MIQICVVVFSLCCSLSCEFYCKGLIQSQAGYYAVVCLLTPCYMLWLKRYKLKTNWQIVTWVLIGICYLGASALHFIELREGLSLFVGVVPCACLSQVIGNR